MLVEQWLSRAARMRPDLPAVQSPAGDLSYAELAAAARAGGAVLRERGAGPGTRVAIALPAGPSFAVALHSCMSIGAVSVPLDMRLSARERGVLAAACDLVSDEPLQGGDGQLVPAGAHDLDAVALIIHTSGTSSEPRPVELTYGNLLWSALGSTVALGLDARERWLCALPLSHVGGLSILIRSAIYASTAVVHERFEADRVLHALEREDVTLVSLVATTLARLLDAGLQDPPRLRCALTGGGPVPAALVDRARRAGVPVSLTYGLTESCSQVTTTPVAQIAAAGPAAGPPLFCTRVRVAPDDEILVRGPTVSPGALAADGWLHTGDLGSLDERGCLHVTGRKADTIVSGGENVAPAEVEAVLEAHPGVLEAAVLGNPDPQWGEAVSAIVVPRPGRRPGEGELRAHCALSLAPYKIPKRFTVRDEPLPRTRSGKLLRRALT
jgi:O-succinylbenzoic acid--CoA ligase